MGTNRARPADARPADERPFDNTPIHTADLPPDPRGSQHQR